MLVGGACFRPKKSLGQNFLRDPVHRERIVDAGNLTANDAVLEVGAGDGSLTALIAARAGRVVAVELDRRLIGGLKERFRSQPHVSVIEGDILAMDPGELMASPETSAGAEIRHIRSGQRFKVIANLPYYAASNVIRRLLESANPPSLMVLTVQREVAQRITAAPPNMSLLSVSVQFYATAQVVDEIPAGAFYPRPKVDSAAVRLVLRDAPLFPHVGTDRFFRVVRAGFSQPRKQLRNSLSAGLGVPPVRCAEWLEAAGVLPRRRAETLALEEWGRVADVAT
jgi:16S rRNA (adenine1518-N6/adenine1519-N6)-dimethyltransferase